MHEDFARLELHLDGAVSNFRYFKSLLRPATKVLVLVKANAYGLGAVQFSLMMQEAGADYLAVAVPDEGVELKNAGISLPVMVLTAGSDSFNEIIDCGLEPCIPSIKALDILCGILRSRGISGFPIHIKLDTGMHRLGFMTGEIPALCEFLKAHPEVCVKSVFTHLAAADEEKWDSFTLGQINMFTGNADTISSAIGYKPMRHVLNTAGIERFTDYQMDMVRLGIGVYGISYATGIKLRPAASLKCKIIQIKEIDSAEETVGYGRMGRLPGAPVRIATLPLGYADGIDRHLGCGNATFSVNGKRVPTIGRICMDMCMVDVTGTDAALGDVVTIFGEDPTLSEIAGILDTIPYEVLARISRRIHREVVR